MKKLLATRNLSEDVQLQPGMIQGHPTRCPVNASPDGGLQGSRIAPDGGLVVLGKLGKSFGFLRSLLFLARQQSNWSPFKILGELWRLLVNPGMRRDILELLKLRPFNEFVQNNPRLSFKYVIPNYLARGLTLTERVSCFLHHYKRLHGALPENFLREILQGDVTLHEISDNVNCFAWTIGLPEPIGDREGELSLDLRVDGKKVFNLSFTIVPGWVLKSEASEVLLITRLQGMPGCNAQIRLARRALHDYSPRGLLLAALQGIANAFGIGEVIAVCATNQKSYDTGCPAVLRTGYDDFFAKRGMGKTATGFYSGSIPIEGKPLAAFKGRNRSRARKRRAMRQQIQSACAAFLLGVVDRAVRPSADG